MKDVRTHFIIKFYIRLSKLNRVESYKRIKIKFFFSSIDTSLTYEKYARFIIYLTKDKNEELSVSAILTYILKRI